MKKRNIMPVILTNRGHSAGLAAEENIEMPVQEKEAVLSLIREHKSDIKVFGVRRLGLFGSFARQQQGKDSDVDILVEFEPVLKTFDNFMHLAFFLEDLFKRHVELVTTDALSPYLGPHILKEVEYVPIIA
jgi:predicted nucleotidyltransferase